MLFLDIETSSPDKEKDWALDFRRNQIDLIAVSHTNQTGANVYNKEQFKEVILTGQLCGHALKFDLKTLKYKGFDVSFRQYEHDTLMMAVASIDKIKDDYLEGYELKRRELNKALPKEAIGYREAGKHSLKTLAPFFLGVSPFWENPLTHNDTEYASKDVLYTKGLYEFFEAKLKAEGTYNFYLDKLMPWQRMSLEAEWHGIHIDLNALQELKQQAEAGVINSLTKLRGMWAKVEEEYRYKLLKDNEQIYNTMLCKAVEKLPEEKRTEAKIKGLSDRYEKLKCKATESIEQFNYASPAQIKWAFQNVLNYPVVDMEGEETTGASLLEMLASQGKEDVKTLLEYKSHYKLAHSYFPSYEELIKDNKITCNFNLNGTRTGRLSSSSPNLQQIPSELKRLFVPATGNSFVSLDLSAIEPVLIAYYSEDETLCKLLINGEDFHGYAAVALFTAASLLPPGTKPADIKKQYPSLRQAAKQADLSIMYGSGVKRLFVTLTMHGLAVTESQCKRMVGDFRQMSRGVSDFKQMLDAECLGGNYVENLFGRKYKIDNPADVYMKAYNRLIQSSASDLLLQGTGDCLKDLAAKNIWASPRLFVHDNAVLECKEQDAQAVYDSLTYHLTKFKLKTKFGLIPLKVEGTHGKTWKC